MNELVNEAEASKEKLDQEQLDLLNKLLSLEKTIEQGNKAKDKMLEEKARRLREMREKDEQLKEMRTEVYETTKKMESVMEDLNKFIETLNREKKHLQTENRNIKDDNLEKNEIIEDLERELKKLKGNQNILDSGIVMDLDMKKKEIGIKREREDQLEKMLESLTRDLEKAKRGEETADAKLEEIEGKMKEVERDAREKELKFGDLNNEVDMLKDEIRYMEEGKDEKEKFKEAGLKREVEDRRKDLMDLQDKINEEVEENRKSLNELETIRQERDQWKEGCGDKENEIKLLKKELEILKGQTEKGLEEQKDLRRVLLTKNMDIDERRKNEEGLRLEVTKILDAKLKADGDKLLAEKERDHARKLAEGDFNYLKEDIEKKNIQNEELRQKLKDLEQEIQELEFKTYGIEKKNRLLADVNEKMDSDLQIKDSRIADLKSQIDFLKKQLIGAEALESINKTQIE